MERDVPEPTVAARRLKHHRRAFVAAGVAIGPFPVRPDGALVQDRIPDAEPKPILKQPGLTARIDDDPRAHIAPPSAVDLNGDADGPLAVEKHIDDAHAFVHDDAVLARVLEHHLIELAARDLPRLRALVRFVVPEIEWRRQPAARVDELHAVLLDEMAALHLRQHVQPLQHPVRLGNQRLADMKAREALALEQLDANALLREQRRHRRPRRAAADHDDVRHFSLRVGPDIFYRAGARPRRCCAAHSRLATAQDCHALTRSRRKPLARI